MYVCVSRRVFDYVYTNTCMYTNTWLRMHVHGCILYYIMITKFTVTGCSSQFFLVMYLLKVTN